ncbi:hypothetical protein [Lentzea flaviverrucosa]|uniref:hypothetical protein n=1 Tax=Lentzea flaviverrucosa TaxID=200379 RepID=UPI000B802030|nr:hypothetical protein [Lentzea flaviverrucosa]
MSTEAERARPAVLLNPIEGDPTDADSHIGGPVLWPIDEPWPTCDGAAHDPASGAEPFVGAVQLYRRDFPELPFPDGADLLQVFLCTLHHDLPHAHGPDVRLVWRDSTTVFELIEEEPEPSVQEEAYVPTVNVLEPIRFAERESKVSGGTKIGGWTPWWQSAPIEFECADCGAAQRQTLSLATHEPSGDDVEWVFGREGNLNVFTCAEDVRHSIAVHVD